MAIENKWPSLKQSLHIIHCVEPQEDIFAAAKVAITRLAADELIAHQINLYSTYQLQRKEISFRPAEQIKEKLMQKVGFEVTKEQKDVLQNGSLAETRLK